MLMMNLGWRGRNERTGLEGIFPRSYVKVLDEKAALSQPTNYGNMPLDVSQSGGPVAANDPRRSKFEEHGKKFGKKMGNAGEYYFIIDRCLAYSLTVLRSNLRCWCHDRIQHRQRYFLS
jgi:hypothetical protein